MLTITKEFRKGILFVRLNGKLSVETISLFNREITELIEQLKISNVVFNISNLEYIDIYGVNELLKNYSICKRNKGISCLCISNNLNIKGELDKTIIREYMKEVNDEISAINLINI